MRAFYGLGALLPCWRGHDALHVAVSLRQSCAFTDSFASETKTALWARTPGLHSQHCGGCCWPAGMLLTLIYQSLTEKPSLHLCKQDLAYTDSLSDSPKVDLLMHDGLPCCTMRFGSTAKVLLKCKLKYYRISECAALLYLLSIVHGLGCVDLVRTLLQTPCGGMGRGGGAAVLQAESRCLAHTRHGAIMLEHRQSSKFCLNHAWQIQEWHK